MFVIKNSIKSREIKYCYDFLNNHYYQYADGTSGHSFQHAFIEAERRTNNDTQNYYC